LAIVTGLYYIGKGGGVDENNPWYDKAKMESDNQFALEYVNMGLKEYPKHVDSLALKIKLLLLIGGRDKSTAIKLRADTQVCPYKIPLFLGL